MTARSERRREALRAETERAAALGREYELGELVASGSRSHTVQQRHWGCMAIIFGVLLVPAGVGAATSLIAGAHDAPLAVAAALVIGGIALYRTAPPQRTDRVFAYTGGVIQELAGEAVPRVIPWAVLDHAATTWVEPDEGQPYLGSVTLTSADGTEIKADGEYRRLSVLQLADQADRVLLATRLPAAIDQCASGLPVEFGTVTVSRDGIAWGGGRPGKDGRSAAWRDVRSVRVDRREIGLKGDGRRSSHEVDLSGVPDAVVAAHLVQEVAGWHRVELAGSPLELPAAPPTEDDVIAARLRLLTEMDVSEILGRPVHQRTGTAAMRFFRADGIHLSVVDVGSGRMGAYNRSAGRRAGREVTGVADQAWLINADRTIIVAAGTATVKLTVSGLPPEQRAGVLIPLGRMVAERLAAPPAGDLAGLL
jgi:hypothetical protein